MDMIKSYKNRGLLVTTLGFLRSKFGRRLLLAVGIMAYLLSMYLILHYSGIGCVFLYAFNVPCPGCGMSRAAMSLLRLDLVAAWQFNPLIFVMPYVFAYILLDLKPERLHKRILLGIGIAALIHWAFVLFQH